MELHKATELAALLSDNDREAVSAARAEVIARFDQRLLGQHRKVYTRMVERKALPEGVDYGVPPYKPLGKPHEHVWDETAKFDMATWFHEECKPGVGEVSGDLYSRSGGKLEDRGQRWTPKKRRG